MGEESETIHQSLRVWFITAETKLLWTFGSAKLSQLHFQLLTNFEPIAFRQYAGFDIFTGTFQISVLFFNVGENKSSKQ